MNETKHLAELAAEGIEDEVDYVMEAKHSGSGIVTLWLGDFYSDNELYVAMDEYCFRPEGTRIVDRGSSIQRLKMTWVPK